MQDRNLNAGAINSNQHQLTNDDGPPSAQSSPYILAFVQALEKQNHTVSVIVPDVQRSWIGKAHIVGQDVQASIYWPPSTTPDIHTPGSGTSPNSTSTDGTKAMHPWILVNSTPATCAQLGLSHFFNDRGPIDLVISGPNYGRNTTAVFALSSGTLGAALEAAVCGYRAIALSFAFYDRTNLPDVVAESCRQAVRVCEYLATNAIFDQGRLYSVNVPVKKGVSEQRVVWTRMLQNQWKKGACFEEVESASMVHGPDAEEASIRRRESDAGAEQNGEGGEGAATPVGTEWRQRHFKWAPRFTDVFESVERAGPGSDGWTVKQGETSVTALRANFMHVEGVEGEVKL
jgi:5'/3'-nucleotidase SurE